jgi:hypothetical protein
MVQLFLARLPVGSGPRWWAPDRRKSVGSRVRTTSSRCALPAVMQATKFELMLNRATAKALSREISPTLLAAAADVIE